MLIQESHVDIPTSSTPMRLFIFHPVIPSGQKARFPAVAVFTEIYQVTAPITRFCRQLAGRGFIAAGCSSYHEFMGPEALAYDDAGTNIYNVIKLGTKLGNDLKVEKTLEGYDEDAKLTIDYLVGLETCNGRVGATGMCLGGHLAFRAAFDPRVLASVCFFGTDIHSETLGKGKKSDSLKRCKEIKGELVMIFGKKDPHVPPSGRDLIRKTLHETGVTFSFYEPAWAQHAFIRDELSKGRYDPTVTGICWDMMMELFGRTLMLDLI